MRHVYVPTRHSIILFNFAWPTTARSKSNSVSHCPLVWRNVDHLHRMFGILELNVTQQSIVGYCYRYSFLVPEEWHLVAGHIFSIKQFGTKLTWIVTKNASEVLCDPSLSEANISNQPLITALTLGTIAIISVVLRLLGRWTYMSGRFGFDDWCIIAGLVSTS